MQTTWNQGQSNTLRCRNYLDGDGNPASGYVHGPGFSATFQDGPRGKDENGNLAPANGAFVEDLLAGAFQRLAHFQGTKFKHAKNAEAMEHIQRAIDALSSRAQERAARGVLGANAV